MMHNLLENPIHLGLGATMMLQPPFTGVDWYIDWYEAYCERHADDEAEGRLVSMHSFTENWDS